MFPRHFRTLNFECLAKKTIAWSAFKMWKVSFSLFISLFEFSIKFIFGLFLGNRDEMKSEREEMFRQRSKMMFWDGKTTNAFYCLSFACMNDAVCVWKTELTYFSQTWRRWKWNNRCRNRRSVVTAPLHFRSTTNESKSTRETLWNC